MLEEHWVAVEGFPNYEVSNYGEIINTVTGRVLQPVYGQRDGLARVKLYLNGSYEQFLVHRLVAQAFFLNYSEDIEVEFKNNEKSDCSVLNLTLSLRKKRGAHVSPHG